MTKLKTALAAAGAVVLALGIAACDPTGKEKAESSQTDQTTPDTSGQTTSTQPETTPAPPSGTPMTGSEPAPTTPPSE